MRIFQVGGLTFVQVGRFSASFCITNKRPRLFDGRALLGAFLLTGSLLSMALVS